MSDAVDSLSVALFSEIFMADALARNRLSRALPKGMEISHFSVLNHLARANV
ncbi:MAG: MarR family transcriptional regulator, partial [Paracoccaceae bacterium]|nr:MarR family transcriptional regulator [Paracoccaceae bacterium]